MNSKNDNITFEYPLNEYMRACLRIENLLRQIDESLENRTVTGSKATLVGLLQTLEILDRPDIKSKLAQMMTQQVSTLSQLEQFPHVDAERLKVTLSQLDTLIEGLNRNRSKIGDSLRNNEFLDHIRVQLGNPGGICGFKSPAYVLWLNLPAEERTLDLKRWIADLNEIREIVFWILKLTRDSSQPQTVTAEGGFYSRSLDPSVASQLVRMTLPASYGVYPEVIVGKYRLTIRFLLANFHENGRSKQYTEKFQFDLTCCKL